MPTYCMICDADDGGCGKTFDVVATMSEAPSLQPTCPHCNQQKPVRRDFQSERHSVNDGNPKTLGQLAEKNAQRLGPDGVERAKAKQNAYRKAPYSGPQPLSKEESRAK